MYWATPLRNDLELGGERSMLARLSPSFETPRLMLRQVERRDLDDLTVVNGDDETTRFLSYGSWRSSDDAEAWYADVVASHASGKSRHFVLLARHDGRDRASAGGRVIGAAVLFNADAVAARVELGYVLGSRDRGLGLMREALQALIARAFMELDLRRIEAFVDPRNVASDRALRSLGFAHEGRLRARGVLKGEVVDSDAYGLLRGEWAASAGC